MIRLTSADECLETLVALARPNLDGQPTADNLKRGLGRLLGQQQPAIPRHDDLEPRWVTAGPEREALTAVFNTRTALDDRNYDQLGQDDPSEDEQRSLALAQQALSAFEEQDEDFRVLFELSMFTVFWAPAASNAGGTTSAAVGVLWMSPKPSWTRRDYGEFYTHELAHTLLFLDEWRRGHFTDRRAMVAPENHAMSAIRRTRRPLDKVLHSAVVASEVLLLREQLLGHPDRDDLHPRTQAMVDGVAASVDSMRNSEAAQELLTPRAWELVDACDSTVNALRVPMG